MHRSRSNRTRSCSQCRTASGCGSRSFAPFAPSSAQRRESFSGQLRPLFDNVPSPCRRANRISRLFYACAFIANSKYRPIPISRSAFLTTTIFHATGGDMSLAATFHDDDDSQRFSHEKHPGARKTSAPDPLGGSARRDNALYSAPIRYR